MAILLMSDLESDGRERSGFPNACESCLGDNPSGRMTRQEYGMECKICKRPFTVFRWKSGWDSRYKKTEICQTCSNLKNACQVCILDLLHALPMQVRDTAFHVESNGAIIP